MENLARIITALDPTTRNYTVIYEELKAITKEFGPITHIAKADTIIINLGKILLEGFDMGTMFITLNYLDHSYSIHQEGEDKLHPHVSDDYYLCEGKGEVAIRNSLYSNHYHNFCLIVFRILHTYVPLSAYYDLYDDEKDICNECGDYIEEGEGFVCDECEDLVHGDCLKHVSNYGDVCNKCFKILKDKEKNEKED